MLYRLRTDYWTQFRNIRADGNRQLAFTADSYSNMTVGYTLILGSIKTKFGIHNDTDETIVPSIGDVLGCGGRYWFRMR